MEDKNNKIIFAYKPIRGDQDDARIISFVGLSSHLEQGMKYNGFLDLWNDIKSIVEEGKEGKHVVNDNIIVFILPETFSRLHTQQYPLVVFNESDNVVDIDEWWYTPFKNMFFNAPIQSYSNDNISWRSTGCSDSALESGYLVRIKSNPEDKTWLYGIKTRNITFDLDD